MLGRKSIALILGLTTGFLCNYCSAAVSLTFSSTAAGSVAASVAPGNTFLADVYVDANSGSVFTGVDYKLAISANGNSLFKILSRTSTSLLNPRFNQDGDAVVAPVLLNSTTGTVNEGGQTPNVNGVTGSGLAVAEFNIQALSAVTPGSYTLRFLPYAATGPVGSDYVSGSPNFATLPFAALGTLQITVTPEPSVMLVAAIGLILPLRRRRSVA